MATTRQGTGKGEKEAEDEGDEKEKDETYGYKEGLEVKSERTDIAREENEDMLESAARPPRVSATGGYSSSTEQSTSLQHQHRQQSQVSSIVINTMPALIQLTPATPCTPISPIVPIVLNNPGQAFIETGVGISQQATLKYETGIKRLQDNSNDSPHPHRQRSSTSPSCSTTTTTTTTNAKTTPSTEHQTNKSQHSHTNPTNSPIQLRRSQSEHPREASVESSRLNQFQSAHDSFGPNLNECPDEEDARESSPMLTSDTSVAKAKCSSSRVQAALTTLSSHTQQHPNSESSSKPESSGSAPCVNQLLLTSRRGNSTRVASAATNNIYSLANGGDSSKISDNNNARASQSSGSSRGRRFWDSSRRSLAKIISSATSSSTIVPQHAGRTLSQTDMAARFSDTEQTTHQNTLHEAGSVGMSSGETSRVSSCELDSFAQQQHQLHHHHHQQHQQQQLPQTSYNPTTITKQLINKARDISRSHNGVSDSNQPTNSPVTGQQPPGRKLKGSKARALSCQQNLARHASSGTIFVPKNSLVVEKFNGSSRCTLNVGGVRHEVLWSTLLKIPKTRLWRLAYTACFLLQSFNNDQESATQQGQHLPSLFENRNQQSQYNRQHATHISQPHLTSLGATSTSGGQLQQQAGYPSSNKQKRRFTLGSRAISTCSGQIATTSLYQQPNPQQHITTQQKQSIGTNKESMRTTTGSQQQIPIETGNFQSSTNNITSSNSANNNTRYTKSLIYKSILQYCDDFNPATNEFFFDRQPRSFVCILDYYRTGKLHLSDELCVMAFKEDLDYWEIDDYNLDSCCQQRYHQKRDNVFEEMKKELESLKEHDEELFGTSQWQRYQKFVWDLLEKPQTSLAARVSIFKRNLII